MSLQSNVACTEACTCLCMHVQCAHALGTRSRCLLLLLVLNQGSSGPSASVRDALQNLVSVPLIFVSFLQGHGRHGIVAGGFKGWLQASPKVSSTWYELDGLNVSLAHPGAASGAEAVASHSRIANQVLILPTPLRSTMPVTSMHTVFD